MTDDRGTPEAPRGASDATSTSASGGDTGTMDASLAARIIRSDAEGASLNDREPIAEPGQVAVGGVDVNHSRPMEAGGAGPKQERGLGIEEGTERAPRTGGRVDAVGATKGTREGDEGATVEGRGVTSVGGAQGDTPGSGVADQPSAAGDAARTAGGATGNAGAARRAGFLEDEGGRYGTETSGGELYDDEGGHIRSAAEVAGDAGRNEEAG